MDLHTLIKELKTLAQKADLTELDKRILLYNYVKLHGADIEAFFTAKINDWWLFGKNVEIAKSYFLSFTDD